MVQQPVDGCTRVARQTSGSGNSSLTAASRFCYGVDFGAQACQLDTGRAVLVLAADLTFLVGKGQCRCRKFASY